MSNPTKLTDYYQPLTCKDSAGNEYICLNEYEAKAIVDMIAKIRTNPALTGFYTGDWFYDVPAKVNKWLSQRLNQTDSQAGGSQNASGDPKRKANT